jgi:peptide/nickel transport system substrate-binding protein/oligopeptide transport system substrate-binding protein
MKADLTTKTPSPPNGQKREMNLLRKIISVTLMPCLLLSCGPAAKPDGTIFRYRLASDPPTLDPAHSTDTTSGAIVLKIFDGLVQFDEKTLAVIPAVAERWTISPDGLVYTFTLRSGVKFHNSRTVTAADFKYSFERVLDPKTASERRWVLDKIKGADDFAAGRSDQVTGIEPVDSITLRITLAEPYAPFLAQLCMEAASVVPREAVEKSGDDQFTRHPVGCGPFTFVRWLPDQEVVLEANRDYYGLSSGTIDRLVFKIITNANVALEAYKNNELDLLDEIPPGQVRAMQEKYPQDVKIWPILGTYYFGFNHQQAPWKDNLALRQAFNHAINKEQVCTVLNEGVSTPARGILPPGLPGYDSTLTGYPYDTTRARALLAEAGYPDGRGLPELQLWYNTNEAHQRVCQYVQEALKKIGVTVTLKNLDWPAYLKALEAGEALFYRMGWIADVPDADNFLYVLLATRQWGAPGNYCRYGNPAFDALVEQARRTIDQNMRIGLYRQAERIAVDDACWIFLYHYGDVMMIKPRWQNVVLPLQGDFAMPVHTLRMQP